MQIVRYSPDDAGRWDAAVRMSRQGTFLHLRNYMDYHADRFMDCSLLFIDGKHDCVRGVLPATLADGVLTSHGGLTYGGLLTPDNVGAAEVLEMMTGMTDWLRRMTDCRRFVYKPVPHIYHTTLAEEDLYAVFRLGGRLTGRSVSQAMEIGTGKVTTLRRRGHTKALKAGLTVEEVSAESDWEAFWNVLTTVLTERHGRVPVHSLAEILLLRSRFPEAIRLFTVKRDGTVLAGCVVYVTARVAHLQYIASGDEVCGCGALDLLLTELNTRDRFPFCRYFDFGISTEQGGAVLNEGLTFQKEGFGGRGVCYDEYEIEL